MSVPPVTEAQEGSLMPREYIRPLSLRELRRANERRTWATLDEGFAALTEIATYGDEAVGIVTDLVRLTVTETRASVAAEQEG